MLPDGKKVFQVSFIKKSGQDLIITHVAAKTEDEAREAINKKYEPSRIVEVFLI